MGGMSRRTWAVLFVIFIASGSLAAQSQVVIAFIGVHPTDKSLTVDEVRVLENRLTADLVQVADNQNYGLIIPNDREQILSSLASDLESKNGDGSSASLSGQVAARAIVAGVAEHIGDRYSLGLNLIRVDTGKTVNRVYGEYSGYDGLIAGSRGLVFALFQIPSIPGNQESGPSIASSPSPGPNLHADETFVSKPNLSMIVGTWEGDKGLQSVRINGNGSATAAIGDNNSMKLSVSIEGDQIIVRQNEPNSPKMYLPFFPYSIAVQIVELARPMSWIFRLTTNDQFLRGTKETSYFRIDRGAVVYVDNTYTRPAEWRKLK
jgi:hypothetical protein